MSEVRRLAALVAKLQDDVATLARERRLAHASMEGGAVNVYQPGTNGRPGVALGQQYDGSYAPVPLGGPVPPTPSAPSATGGVERLLVRWGGTFAGGDLTVAPQDWARAEIHVGTSPTPSIMFDTLKGTIESPRGGELSVTGLTPDTDYYVWLVGRSQAGKFSAPSQVVGPVRVTRLTVEDLDLEGIGGNTIHRQDTAPTGDHKVGDLWLKTPENIAHRWEGDPGSWVAAENTRIAEALQDAFDAQQTADGANTAALGAQTAAQAAANVAAGKTTTIRSDTQPSTTGRTIGDEWIKTNSGNLRHVWSGSAWVAAPIGNGAIAPKSLVASDVIATGTVSAALLESVLVLATTIIAGDANGSHARMTPTGFRVFRQDANGDGVPDEVVRLGTNTDDVLAIVRANGSLAAALDSTGFLSASGVSSRTWPQIGAPDHTGRGGDLNEILDRRGRALVAWNFDTGIFDSATAAGRGCFDLSARLFFGRMYRIAVRCRINAQVANDALAEVQVRYSQSDVGHIAQGWVQPPAAPTINSPLVGRVQGSTARPEAQTIFMEKLFSLGPGDSFTYRDMRLLLCLARPVGTTTISMYGAGIDATEMWVEDIGPYVPVAATRNDGGGTVANPGPAPAPAASRFTRSWAGTWHQNWLPSGAPISLPGASQGIDPVNGNMRSYIGFGGTALDGSGVTMDHIIGGVIESVSVWLYSWHWYWDDGGDAMIGMHGFRDGPPGVYGGGDEWMVGDVWFQKPGGRWVDLAPAGFDKWANGTWKGIMLGSTLPGAGTTRHYGRFTDETDPYNKPVLTVTYRK